jgi:ferrous iron transport protein B
MFFMLSLLEDSGYMARAAFVMDRALRAIGLPGNAFIPMIVGFGCTVPAIMATRTLENKRDRYLTVYMAPFMSCGARLPVFALFGAAFFGKSAGLMVLSLYLVGIVLAVGTGFMLKNTLFKGEPAPFIMELPPYHAPRMGTLIHHAWIRLKVFLLRAGRVIVIVVALLGVLNSIGTDLSFGNEDSRDSVLSFVGQGISPIFEPMGLKKENWPATVGMFTGLFAKEAVVGTLNGLYGQLAAKNQSAQDTGSQEEEESWNFLSEVGAAFLSIPEAFAGLADTLLDPIGLSIIGDDDETLAEEIGADAGLFSVMRSYFGNDTHAAYAYLLFILIYFPCIAALGAIIKEIGPLFGWTSIVYLTVLAWITSTLYYQLAVAHTLIWIVVPLCLLAAMILGFSLLRRRFSDA